MLTYETLRQRPFVLAGPCVIESERVVMHIAEELKRMTEELDITFVFKASFDKANRTSVESYRGPGIKDGLRMLQKVKETFNVPITTDIHEPWQAAEAAPVVDILQIPAFLCRQTDLVVAAGNTGRIVNIKKAQFLGAADMLHPAKKVETTGNTQIMLTERGTNFGSNLVVDYRNVVEMQKFGYPVVMDITHSCQKPGGGSGTTAGNREFAAPFAFAAAAVGVRGFFVETHPEPEKALSDGPNMVRLQDFKALMSRVQAFMAV